MRKYPQILALECNCLEVGPAGSPDVPKTPDPEMSNAGMSNERAVGRHKCKDTGKDRDKDRG